MFSWMNSAKTTVLSGFWQKNGLGPLKVNHASLPLKVLKKKFSYKLHLIIKLKHGKSI